ncbi:MAG: hypothetical protein HKN72_10935 [Gemmatimonadetes bacterium]|nr:hypothetical protein [Gemmatimonadota bacterium]NNF13734.1 hypothetical protein [Gemmatimonadota bacterium]
METQQATRLEYGPVYRTEDQMNATSQKKSIAFRLNEAFTWAALIVCLAGWTVVGFFLWIPRVIRAVLMFSLSLVQATVMENDLAGPGRRLRSAANFYRRGFVSAVDSIRPPEDGGGSSDGDLTIEGGLILRETAWALFVWYLFLWWIDFPMITPVNVATFVGNVDWAGIWSGLVDAAATIPDGVSS